METQVIKEGEVELEVPKLENYRTSLKEYVPSRTSVFFNPVMELSRDMSVSSLQVMTGGLEGPRVCDLLAGVGARGLRYAKEVRGIGEVIINDRSPEAVDLIRKNVERNGLTGVEVSQKDANTLLHDRLPPFNAMDVDPFGTPVPFLDSSFSAIYRRGILLVTATDTAPLCGAHPKACLRKYGAKPLRTPYSRELGLRILIGSIQRRAAAYDLALSPVLSHATQHYFRAHFRVTRGARRANRILEGQGHISHCFKCGRRLSKKGLTPELPRVCECGREFEHAGPMWLGNFAIEKHLREVVNDLSTRNFRSGGEERDLLELCAEEVGGPSTFYDIHEVSSRLNTSPPRFKRVIDELQDLGYFVSRTHFSDTGMRTDAPLEVLSDAVAS